MRSLEARAVLLVAAQIRRGDVAQPPPAPPCDFCGDTGHYDGAGSMWCDCAAGARAYSRAHPEPRQ